MDRYKNNGIESGDEMSKIVMKDISIEFPGVKALDNAHIEVNTGEIHALIGANGAGKSTLMKVLSGLYKHWTGSITIDGKEVDIRSIAQSKDNGIEIVYQEVDTALVPNLSVAENIMIDEIIRMKQGRMFINWSYIIKEAKRALDILGFEIDVNKNVENLTLAEKQMVLISKAVYKESRFIILDEPTAPLSTSEAENLFAICRELKKKDIGIIFISHRLPELFQISDKITVLRNGQYVATNATSDLTTNQLVEMMLGKEFANSYPKKDVEIGEVVYEVKNLVDNTFLKDVSFNVRKGEIVGISGLVGAGKTELCKAMFGASKVLSGEVMIHGKSHKPKSPSSEIEKGIVLIPEERRKEGILVNENVVKNITLPTVNNFTRLTQFMNFSKEKRAANKVIENLGIKTPSEFQEVQYLSGGNQQKIAIGKWIISNAEVYVFDEPTKGIDVGAKADVYSLIADLVEKGKSVIYVTCEFQEILGITDRTYVMYNGEIVKELKTSETNEKELLFYSVGGEENGKKS